jgi:hypothetical protein
MNKCILMVALALGVLASSRCLAEMPENQIYVELIEKGVPLADGNQVKLPEFTMADGLDQAAQEKVLKAVLATKKDDAPTLKQLLDNKLNAPFILVLTSIPDSDGHQVDLYFVAYGKLQTVSSGSFWKSRIGQQTKENKLEFLETKDLKPRGLQGIDQPTIKEKYAFADINLFDSAKVSGTARCVETIGDESVVVGISLDSRFQKDKEFPNQWRKITFDSAGGKKIGNPNPYDGIGAYAKVTRLKAPDDALFVEYHIIYNEPQGWFEGRPVLDSKIRTMIDNDVKSFRKDLRSAPASAPAPAAKQQVSAGPQATVPTAAGSTSKK